MAWSDVSIIQLLGLTLLHFIWQGAVIGALYGFTLLMLRPGRSSVAYHLAILTLLMLALAPVVTFIYLAQAAPGATSSAIAGTESLAAATLMVSQQAPAAGATLTTLLPWIVAGWLAGVIILSLRLAVAWQNLVRLRKSADYSAAAFLRPRLETLKASMGVSRNVAVALTNRIVSPLVIGWLRPVILLPPSVVCGLPMRQIEMILAHELAHIRRYDHLVNLFQIVVETLLFYHPVVLWVSRRIRIERENACDDLAIRTTESRLDYVEMLAALEGLRQRPWTLALAINDGQILSRIRRLVQPPRPRRQRGVIMPAVVGVMLVSGISGVALWPDDSESQEAREIAEPAEPVINPEIVQFTLPEPDQPEPAGSGSATAIDLQEIPADASAIVPARNETTREEAQPAIENLEVAGIAPVSAPEPTEDAVPETEIEQLANSEVPEINDPATPEPTADANPEASQSEAVLPQEDSQIPDGVQQEPALDQDQALAAVIPPQEGLFQQARIPDQQVEEEKPRLTGGELVEQVAPDYPTRARRNRSNGIVELEFRVNESGRVEDIQVIDEHPGGMNFGNAAMEAVAQWQFEPFQRDGKPRSHPVQIEIEFDLERDCPSNTTGTRIPRC